MRRAAGIALSLTAWVYGVAGCSSDTASPSGDSSDAGSTGGVHFDSCAPGEFRCVNGAARPCDSTGDASQKAVDCASAGKECVEPYGCVACAPGSQSCANGRAQLCREDGSGFDSFECDPVQGMRCEPEGCRGVCAPGELGGSYIGCDYYPTVTLNSVWSGFDFAVAIANAGEEPAHVTVTRGTTSVEETTVAGGALAVVRLPWVDELKGGDEDACRRPPEPGASRIVRGGAYRLRTDQPVTVYQFSPLEFERAPVPDACPLRIDCSFVDAASLPERERGLFSRCLSFTNDASLLFPASSLTGAYTTLSWPSRATTAGFITVTATANDTEVRVSGAGLAPGGLTLDDAVTLQQGDVLQLVARSEAEATSFDPEGDLSGHRIQASHPVQVIAGHSCANIPEPSTGECDHLEDAVLPAETLGSDYLVTFPAALASVSPHTVRITAVEDATRVETEPELFAPRTIGPGDVIEIPEVTEDFRVLADGPILVAQYMLGQKAVPSGAGDPSMAMAVPTEQFRSSYLFIASKTYDVNFVNIVARTGTAVTLDGQRVSPGEFSSIGNTGYSVARHSLDEREVHAITSTEPFGILVYGYGDYTSFMYPGGLDLARLSPPVVFVR